VTADAARVVNYLGPLNRLRGLHHKQAELYHVFGVWRRIDKSCVE
jgi:hypothetical protein